LRRYREFKSAIREISALIRESRSRPLLGRPIRSSRDLERCQEAKEGRRQMQSLAERATPRSPSRTSCRAPWVASRAPRCPELKVGRGTEGSNPAPIQWSTEPKLKTTSKGRSNTRRSSRRYCGCWKIHKFSKNSSPTTPSARSRFKRKKAPHAGPSNRHYQRGIVSWSTKRLIYT